jgi:CubicO group peptidase (beta-lactamase class C family)
MTTGKLIARHSTIGKWSLFIAALIGCWIAGGSAATLSGFQVDEILRQRRQQFQAQEIIPSRFGGWVFQEGTPTPRLIWRDVDEVRRLGCDAALRVRWFDGDLTEAAEPNHAGRWMAWVDGQAPNGTPLRRAFTFYVFPQKIDDGQLPDLTVAFPNFPGKNPLPAWVEHRAEIEQAAEQSLTRGFIDSEQAAVLIAGLAEAKPLGRAARFIESAGILNDDCHLALKLKVLGLQDKVRPLAPPRVRSNLATVIRAGTPEQAGVPATAKAAIDSFCREWNEATGEPFVILVAKNGVIVTHEAFGVDANGQPINRDYRCWIASLTKTVTGLMFSRFVDQHLIDLDDRLSRAFPDYPRDDPQVPTFRQCLNHTAGLAGHGDFGGMRNPNLENIVLNGIDVNEPGKAHAYSGMGYELAAKAMELVAGQSAARLYHEHLFEPLGFGDVTLGNASSDGHFTAYEMAVLGQWMANRGSYGELEFISPATFERLLPEPLHVSGAFEEYGVGIHWIRHRRPGAAADSRDPADLLFSPRTIGHGSFSGCILNVDLEQQLVIVQVRAKFADADNAWWARYFQTIAQAIAAP